jgi:hypothetical protein
MNSNQINRRAILAGAAAAGAAMLAPARAFAATRALATGSAGDWRLAIGTNFTAATEYGPVTLRLSAVDLLAADPLRPAGLGRAQPFTATFDPIGGARPGGNRSYRLTSLRYLAMDVFFAAATVRLIAVFN